MSVQDLQKQHCEPITLGKHTAAAIHCDIRNNRVASCGYDNMLRVFDINDRCVCCM